MPPERNADASGVEPGRVSIKGLGPDALADAMRELGEPAYRAGQLRRWLYRDGAVTFDEMTDLPASLRTRLAHRFDLALPRLVERQASSTDGTRKYLWRLADGVTVESVGIPAASRLTVCFSTQAGCAMGCAFCATGQGGYVRGLEPGEMVDQVRMVGVDFGERVTNAVAMGQGEPFADYDSTLAALRFMNAPDGLGIGARHLTISTCGILSGIERLATEPEQFTLAVSLHSAVQATRDRIMPGVRAQPLTALRETLIAYTHGTGRRVTFEFALIAGVNDTPAELSALVAFCSGLLCHVNLIPVNPVVSTASDRPAEKTVRAFQRALADAGVETSVRVERGADIDAACGQLTQRRSETG